MDESCNFGKSALILAGGRGIRFWPLSRFNNPKQFHDLLGKGKPILESTVKRLNGVVSKDQIFISTRGSLKESISNGDRFLIKPMVSVNNTVIFNLGK